MNTKVFKILTDASIGETKLRDDSAGYERAMEMIRVKRQIKALSDAGYVIVPRAYPKESEPKFFSVIGKSEPVPNGMNDILHSVWVQTVWNELINALENQDKEKGPDRSQGQGAV